MNRVKVHTSEIHHLVQSLNNLGHTVNGHPLSVNTVIAGLLDLGQKAPNVIKEQALQKLDTTERFSQHGDSLYSDSVGTHQERLANVGNFCRETFISWNKSKERGGIQDMGAYPPNQDFSWVSNDIDLEYIMFFFENHDIPEGILDTIGDISTVIKAQLDDDATETLTKLEVLGLDHIGSEGFQVSDNYYEKLRSDTRKKSSVEAHIGSFLDKSDGLCACLLEVLQGNEERIVPLRKYIRIFQSMSQKPISHLVRSISHFSASRKKKGSSTVSDIFNINEIISLDGQENIGIQSAARFPDDVDGNKKFDEYLRKRFLGRGNSFLFQEWNENALTLKDNISLPGFFQAWLICQSVGIFERPARDLSGMKNN